MLEPANFRVEALAHAQRQNRKYPFVGPTSGDLVQVKLSQFPSHVSGILENSVLFSAAVATTCRHAATMTRKIYPPLNAVVPLVLALLSLAIP